MTVVRDLTNEEFTEADFLSRRLLHLSHGANNFASQCLAMARIRQLTRGQFVALREAVKKKNNMPDDRTPRRFIHQHRSKKPVTLFSGGTCSGGESK